MKTRHLFVAFAAVALVGAGCFSSAPKPAPAPVVPAPAPAPAPTKPIVPVPTPAPTSTSVVPTPATSTSSFVLPTIDDTWKTYENKALGFSFQWPTKGRYAPTWEVTFVKESDPSIANGCHTQYFNEAQPPTNVTSNGFAFCHTSYSDGAAGTIYMIDDYATKIGSQYVVIAFQKSYSSVTNPTYDRTAYSAHLDQIVGTIKKTE